MPPELEKSAKNEFAKSPSDLIDLSSFTNGDAKLACSLSPFIDSKRSSSENFPGLSGKDSTGALVKNNILSNLTITDSNGTAPKPECPFDAPKSQKRSSTIADALKSREQFNLIWADAKPGPASSKDAVKEPGDATKSPALPDKSDPGKTKAEKSPAQPDKAKAEKTPGKTELHPEKTATENSPTKSQAEKSQAEKSPTAKDVATAPDVEAHTRGLSKTSTESAGKEKTNSSEKSADKSTDKSADKSAEKSAGKSAEKEPGTSSEESKKSEQSPKQNSVEAYEHRQGARNAGSNSAPAIELPRKNDVPPYALPQDAKPRAADGDFAPFRPSDKRPLVPQNNLDKQVFIPDANVKTAEVKPADKPHENLKNRYETGEADKAIKMAKELGLPLAVHIGATWCPPCRQMESGSWPALEGSGNKPGSLQGKAVILHVDVDQISNYKGETASALKSISGGVGGYPTIRVFNFDNKGNARQVGESNGYMSSKSLQAFILQHGGRR